MCASVNGWLQPSKLVYRSSILLTRFGISPYGDTFCRLDGGIDHNKNDQKFTRVEKQYIFFN